MGSESVLLGNIIQEGVIMKKCSTCKIEKSESDFYKDNRRADGLKSQCKKCHSITSILSRDKDNHRDCNREWHRKSKYGTRQEVRERAMLRSRARNKSIEIRARALANRAIDLGFLARPKECPKCHRTDLTVHAHHDDYSKPLDVYWLCSECHGEAHRLVNDTK
jgi:hypothetical protein